MRDSDSHPVVSPVWVAHTQMFVLSQWITRSCLSWFRLRFRRFSCLKPLLVVVPQGLRSSFVCSEGLRSSSVCSEGLRSSRSRLLISLLKVWGAYGPSQSPVWGDWLMDSHALYQSNPSRRSEESHSHVIVSPLWGALIQTVLELWKITVPTDPIGVKYKFYTTT